MFETDDGTTINVYDRNPLIRRDHDNCLVRLSEREVILAVKELTKNFDDGYVPAEIWLEIESNDLGTGFYAKDMEEPTYEVVVCKLCGQQARWLQADRLSYCWQCNNPEHGYKYLSADQTEIVTVKPVRPERRRSMSDDR